MALIVEDGTGKPDADAYISSAAADAYHLARGSGDAWDAADDKDAVIRKATDYLEQNYSTRWVGTKMLSTQALTWPRSRAYVHGFPVTALPVELVKACAELALRAITEELSPDIDPTVASESVGPISVSYFQGERKTKRYEAVERMLEPLLTGSGSIPVYRG